MCQTIPCQLTEINERFLFNRSLHRSVLGYCNRANDIERHPDTPFPENSRRQQEKTSGVTYLHTNDPFAGKAEPATIDSSHPGQHSLMVLINAQFTFHDWKKNVHQTNG